MDQVQRWTGVHEIASLKQAVVTASTHLERQTAVVHKLRQSLAQQQSQLEELSRQHSQKMQTRSAATWTEQDVHEFARLTAAEGQAGAKVQQSRQELLQAEEDWQAAQLEYMDALRKRYHEEQVWQDKWRVLGTYWTWGLIALNSVVFMAGQYLQYRREEVRLNKIQDLLREGFHPSTLSSSGNMESSNAAMATTGMQLSEGASDPIAEADEPHKEAETQKTTLGAIKASLEGEGETSAADLQLTHTCDSGTDSDTDAASTGNSQAPQNVPPDGDTSNESLVLSNWKERLRHWRRKSMDGVRKSGEDLQEQWKQQAARLGLKQLHWPSVAVGAVAASFGILLASSLQKRN